MKLSKFTLSDGDEVFEGYTDGSLWNGWANVCFTKEQVIEFLKSTPYDFHFETFYRNTDEHGLIIHWEDEEFYPSSPLPIDNGDILEGYFLDGLEFMEVTE